MCASHLGTSNYYVKAHENNLHHIRCHSEQGSCQQTLAIPIAYGGPLERRFCDGFRLDRDTGGFFAITAFKWEIVQWLEHNCPGRNEPAGFIAVLTDEGPLVRAAACTGAEPVATKGRQRAAALSIIYCSAALCPRPFRILSPRPLLIISYPTRPVHQIHPLVMSSPVVQGCCSHCMALAGKKSALIPRACTWAYKFDLVSLTWLRYFGVDEQQIAHDSNKALPINTAHPLLDAHILPRL
jgi:hypothetical protein